MKFNFVAASAATAAVLSKSPASRGFFYASNSYLAPKPIAREITSFMISLVPP